MDTLPDYEIPKTPEGFEFVGIRHPKVGDYMVDYYGKPYRVTKENVGYMVEHQPVYKKKK